MYSSDPESSDYGHAQSPLSSGSPHQMYTDHYRSPEEDHEPTVPHQKPGKGHSNAFQDRLVASQDQHLGKPQGKGTVNPNKEHKSSHKEKCSRKAKSDEKSSLGTEKLHKTLSREENQRMP
ncbi:Transcription elongation factor B polypeptide 3 [Heterocephalus glaber]|uniref:Transcription elongation factor B polypeptide 3 n=1 Tax=Heterocephalus glaber TaxID=10181 RepID=G5C138_HETGA|nr:Transcription elongation factor B polypeptide 3 [Heterocephalus glaber]